MGRSSSSDSASRSSRRSRKEVRKSKKNKSEKRSRHSSRSPDTCRKRSRSRSRERNRHHKKSRSRSRDRYTHGSKKSYKSNRSSRRRHSRSRKRSRSKEYSIASHSRKSSDSTAGSSAEDSTGSEPLLSDESSSRHSQPSKKSINLHVGDITKSRSSRESATPSNNSNTAFNSREGSCVREGGQDMIAAKLSAAELAAIAAEKALGMKPREGPTAESSVDVVAKLRMDTAIRDVETASFEQKTFISSRSQPKTQQTSKLQAAEQFHFGTSAEKAAAINNGISDKPFSTIITAIAGEGLCHPNLFGDPVKREERWLDYLYKLRQSIHAEKQDNNVNVDS